MGFTVLIVAPWYPAGPIKYIAEAFERIGCEVIRIGATYNDHMGLSWGTDAVVPDRELPREAPCWDLNEFVDWTTRNYQAPDMLLVSEENYQTDIRPTKKIPSVLWSFDGWPNSFARVELFQPTLAYMNHPYGVKPHPREAEDPRWRFMPAACAPWLHKNLRRERSVDFCLLATPYRKRPELAMGLAEHWLTVRFGQKTSHEYVLVYNMALSTYHNCNRQEEVKFRFFEAAAMGCINISDHTRLFETLGYKPGQHYILIEDEDLDEDHWPTVDALAETITDLRALPELARQIADNAYQHTVRHHTYFSRCRQIFSDLHLPDMVAEADETIERKI